VKLLLGLFASAEVVEAAVLVIAALVSDLFTELTVDLAMEELDPDTLTPGLMFRFTVTSPILLELAELLPVRSESLEQEPITMIAAKAAKLNRIFFIFILYF
jgi:hypothetical protein